MPRIALSRGYFAEVDDADFDWLTSYNWSALLTDSDVVYAYGKFGDKNQLMHRVILGARRSEQVDHIDGDGLNNRRSNLRICTHAQNLMNKPARGYRKQKGRYYARIMIEGKEIALGGYATEEEATAAYQAATKRYFGEFACAQRG